MTSTSTKRLSAVTPGAPVERSAEREGLNITLGDLKPGAPVAVSDVWSVGGWDIQFVRLGANQMLGLDQNAGRIFIKVVTGRLSNIDRGPFAAAKAIRDTRVDEDHVQAGAEGALFTVFTETSKALDNINSMDQLGITGPHGDVFKWQRCDEKFSQFTDFFDGKQAYTSPGFHLLDADGTEITYVYFWTLGKGVDILAHNHSNEPSPTRPAFAEVHWVFNNGTGKGGMYETAEPGSPSRQRYPMQRGQEHGPFFFINEDGTPRLRDNGSVEYPWHSWESGTDDQPGEAFDFFAAFETNPDYVIVSGG